MIEFNFANYQTPPINVTQGETFKQRGFITRHTNIVIHENAGSIDRKSLCDYLNKKGYGYHLTIGPEGDTVQHGDLAVKYAHGGKLNPWGIGICILNPYYPHLVNTDEEEKYFKIIPAGWWTHCSPKTDRHYSKPTEAQIDTLIKLIPYLCVLLDIPRVYPTKYLNRQQRKIKNWRLPGVKPGTGIVAHSDYSKHADGRYLLERLIEASLPPCPMCGK